MENINKKKNDLLSSILKNPKLSKSFSEAMSAPIGSTKRTQAKSVLSIMKRLGGIRNDGIGGPMQNTQIETPVDKTESYDNMMIFPAAPKFKTKPEPTVDQNAFSGQGGYHGEGGRYDGKGGIIDTLSGSNIFGETSSSSSYGIKTRETPQTEYPNIFPKIASMFTVPEKYKNLAPKTESTFGNYNLGQVGSNVVRTIKGEPMVSPTPSVPTVPIYPTPSGLPLNQSYPNLVPTPTPTPTGTPTTTTTPTPTGTPTTPTPTGTPIVGTPTTTRTPTVGPTAGGAPVLLTEADKIKKAAESAVSAGTGAGMFSLGIVNEKYGGSLQAYLSDLDKKLKTDFNLAPLETELSNLKAQKANLVPTLTDYIRGKDTYLSAIDQMIDNAESQLLKEDMGNPAVSSSYNNYLTYLYTLKGRQNSRYGKYLNSAIDDYNAEVDRTQSNYENVYNQYNDAITRTTDIAQSEYETLYNTMSDLYTSLENAPIRRASLDALKLENLINQVKLTEDLIGQNYSTNEDYQKELIAYTKKLEDSDGNFNMAILGDSGLEGLFAEVDYMNGDRKAMAKAISNVMSNTIANSGGDMEKVAEYKKLINDLAKVEGGGPLAAMLYPGISTSSSQLTADFVLNNLGSIKKATKDLVKSGFWSKKTGLTDKEGWKKDHSDLGEGFLENLYNSITANYVGTEYEKDPKGFIKDLFAGDDETAAQTISNILN